MNRKLVGKLLMFSSIAGSAYLCGKYSERLHNLENSNTNTNVVQIIPKPGLPIFGTVSAAVPVPSQQEIQTDYTSMPNRVSQIMKYGFPGLDNVRSYSDHVLSYDRRNRVPHWVFEHLTPLSVQRNESVDRAKCDFRVDESIHPFFRSENSDYRRSGFDRGHMAAAGNHRLSQKHCEDTFYLTNMAPQVGQGFNRDSWNRLEMYVRKLAKLNPNVYVCTGPLYLPRKEDDGKMYVKYQVIGINYVAVPTHFYKVIVVETPNQHLEMESYIMPNQIIKDDTPLEVFQVPPETIERSAGLLFFDRINRKQLTKINGKKIN